MKYKYLLFDADDTLLDFLSAEKNAFYKLLESKNIKPTPLLLERYSDINLSLWKRFEKGIVKKEDIGFTRYYEFIKEQNLNGDAADFDSTYHTLLGLQGETFQGASDVCCELIKRGYILFIVTNGFADTQESRLDLSGLKPYIEQMFVSETLGVQKPQKEFFCKVFKEIGSNNLSDYLIIGDSLSSDIKGGINAGIDTCWFNSRMNEPDNGINPTYTITSLNQLLDIL